MPDKARIGVIGTGSWSTLVHIPALLKHPAAEVVAICDRDRERLNRAGNAFGISARFLNHAEMLATNAMDGVIIATSAASHYEIARDCLQKDLHVLCEKPLTLHAQHARELTDLAGTRGRELMVGYPANYSSAVLQIRAAIANGQSGEIRLATGLFASLVAPLFRGEIDGQPSSVCRINSHSRDYNDPKERGGGHGHIQMTHLLGLFYFITTLRPVQVQARMRMQDELTDLEDALLVTFENGAIATFAGTAQAVGGWRQQIVIYADKCCVTFDTAGECSSIGWQPGSRQDFANVPDQHNRWLVAPNLVDVILGRAPNGSPASCGLRAVETIEAAYRSAVRNGQVVTVAELYS